MPSDNKTDDTAGTDEGVTLINVIEVSPEQIDKFMADWEQRAHHMRTLPGLRDYTLHRALLEDSRFQLVNVAHWESADAFESAISNPKFLAMREAAFGSMDFEVQANVALYKVIASESGPATK
ncbi:antibiotic biosynthesis monooxygenase family protein [Nocardia vinacea]|uniref:antibiotic biosynthesis monooxygenase family protein n=1 Tax=Nocardia vinacea TaxID=96468 RepID=UPI0033E261B6